MSSVIVEDKTKPKAYQLFTMGTAEIVQEFCSDYWNGNSVLPLTTADRQRILDFYYTSGLTMKCFAFCYRPVYHCLRSEQQKFPIARIELPLGVDMNLPTRGTLIDLPEPVEDIYTDSNPPLSLVHAKLKAQQSYKPVRFTLGVNEEDLTASSTHIPTTPQPDLSPFPTATPDAIQSPIASYDKLNQLGIQASHTEREDLTKPKCGLALVSQQQNQIFLGMIAVQEQTTPSISRLIEDCTSAGIRFLYFSQDDELQSRAFAEKLGLETGFNCYISLSDEDQCYVTECENIARLPRGIAEIRPHIQQVDDVPLLVPLFTESTPVATQEMIKILQEYGGIVCVIGSSLSWVNGGPFGQADISLAMHPHRDPPCLLRRNLMTKAHARTRVKGLTTKHTNHIPSSEFIGSTFNALPCSLTVQKDAENRLFVVIKKARKLGINLRQCFLFFILSLLTLSMAILASFFLYLPPMLSPLQLLWLICLILPMISLPFMLVPGEPGIMQLMTTKNDQRFRHVRRYALYDIIRSGPTICILVLLFALSLYGMCSRDYSCHSLLGNTDMTQSSSWNGLTTHRFQALVYAQNIVCWMFVFYSCLASASRMHRTQPLTSMRVFHNKVWIVAVLLALVLQTIFFVVSVSAVSSPTQIRSYSLSDVPAEVYAIGFAWAPVLLIVHELVKTRDKKLWVRDQKRARLEFGTKLGMHSPQ
eukprot:m.919781 g.919781  ORF g.919781 m.919781 type:complete len:702 (-) comp60199_c0_seq1:1042-3147(-)